MRIIAPLIILASVLPVGSPQIAGTQAPGQADPSPSSYQLINRALEAKRIDEETAHKYRVFAAFGDSRLPAAYRGNDTRPEPPAEVEIAGSLLDKFSPQTRSELAPFFMRPDEPGSWITLATVSGQEPTPDAPKPPDDAQGSSSRGGGDGFVGRYAEADARVSQSGWRSFPAAGGKAKVWAQNRYPGDAAKAQALANALTSLIWDKLTTLMRKTPKTDAAFVKNGGDDALDFYLVHAPRNPTPNPLTGKAHLWDGWAKSSDPKNTCHDSRFILIDSNNPLVGNRRTNGILSVATHELFHAIQFAYNTPVACNVIWIRESTATWAANLVYPTEDSEHSEAKEFLVLPHRPLDSEASQHHAYGAYLLPYFREMTTNNTAFMRTMWENFERLAPTVMPSPGAPPPTVQQRIQAYRNEYKQVRQGVDGVLTRGFEETWPKFLVRNWTRPPVDQPDGYRKWDRLKDTVFVWGGRQNVETPAGLVTKKIEFPFDAAGNARSLPYLAGHYQHFAFRPSVRSVVFHNTIAEMGQPHTSVWGIVKIGATWKDPADWTREFQLAWCRDDSKEDIEELAIVFGNSDWETEQPLIPRDTPTVKAYPVGCTAWSGTTVTTNTITTTDPSITITEVVRSSMRFIVDSSFIQKDQPRQYWKVESGTLSWQVNVTGSCTGQAQGNLPIRDMGPGDEVATLQIWEEAGKIVVSGLQGPWPADIPTYTVTCPGSSEPPALMLFMTHAGWFGTDSDRNQLAADGKSFGGDFTSQPVTGSGGSGGSGGSIVTRWKYSFHVSP